MIKDMRIETSRLVLSKEFDHYNGSLYYSLTKDEYLRNKNS